MLLQMLSSKKLLFTLITFKLEVPMSHKMPSQIFQPYKGLAAFSAAMGPPAVVVHHVRLVVPPNTKHFSTLPAIMGP